MSPFFFFNNSLLNPHFAIETEKLKTKSISKNPPLYPPHLKPSSPFQPSRLSPPSYQPHSHPLLYPKINQQILLLPKHLRPWRPFPLNPCFPLRTLALRVLPGRRVLTGRALCVALTRWRGGGLCLEGGGVDGGVGVTVAVTVAVAVSVSIGIPAYAFLPRGSIATNRFSFSLLCG